MQRLSQKHAVRLGRRKVAQSRNVRVLESFGTVFLRMLSKGKPSRGSGAAQWVHVEAARDMSRMVDGVVYFGARGFHSSTSAVWAASSFNLFHGLALLHVPLTQAFLGSNV